MNVQSSTSASARPWLSVVIPSYNEEKRLPRAISEISAFLRSLGRSHEIIVVNDGSKDRTAEVTKELATKFPEVRLLDLNPNRGKGGAVKAGMLAAEGALVLFTDADQSTPITEVTKLIEAIEKRGYDVAIGSRAVAGSEVEQAQVWYRKLAGVLFGIVTRWFVLSGVADTQCGFKCLTREAAQRIFPKVTSATAIFDIEMLVIATREGYRVAELPVHWVHDPDTRIPYNLRRSLGVFAELFRIRRVQGLPRAVRIRK